MQSYEELRELFLTRYDALKILNEHVAVFDYGNTEAELTKSTKESYLGYYNLQHLEEDTDLILKALEVENAKLDLDDPVEEDYLCANQLITL